MTTANKILSVADLSVSYGSFRAVKSVSFDVYEGEIFGLLGPNGAGKTSTLSAIEGLLKFDTGMITVSGIHLDKRPLEARAQMGVQFQSTSFQPELTVAEILKLYGGLYGVRLDAKKILMILEELKLADGQTKRYGQLSGGQQQRVSLYIATFHEPPLVLLDEPTTGLDPQSRRQLWGRIEALRDEGHGILLTTHSMEEAEAICDRVAIIDHGVIIDTGVPQELVEKYQAYSEVLKASRKGRVTLEDVFIGLTGSTVRS
jgi:ABC-2 type transport system ATP-binding protein